MYLFCSRMCTFFAVGSIEKIIEWYSVTSATFAFTNFVMALLVSHPDLGKKICYTYKKICEISNSHINILLQYFFRFCHTCSLNITPNCELCPSKGGAMKKAGPIWAHLSCALWIPEVSTGCACKMEPIIKMSR